MHIRRKPLANDATVNTFTSTAESHFTDFPLPNVQNATFSTPYDPEGQQTGITRLYLNEISPSYEDLSRSTTPLNDRSILHMRSLNVLSLRYHKSLPSSPDVDNNSSNHSFFSASTLTPSGDDFFDYPFPGTLSATESGISTPNLGADNGTMLTSTTSTQSHPATKSEKVKAKITSGLEDTSIFLGGLLRKPIESRKHYTILRHSCGLIYYKGADTSIAITIFADRPLPADRRFWFQMKGWTGNAGMATKALLSINSSWIDVTPEREIGKQDLIPLDERAFERDIYKFKKRAPKELALHMERETVVIRVPAEATDGYFRIVMTVGDKKSVLCPSPVFRIASTSMSSASLKGASLVTLPLELSVKLAQAAATTFAVNAAAPVAAAVKVKAVAAIPASITTAQTAVQASVAATKATHYNGKIRTVCEFAKVEERVKDKIKGEIGSAVNRADNRRKDIHSQLTAEGKGVDYEPMERDIVVGNDHGPDEPFPLRLQGDISPGSGHGRLEYGVPTANLDNLPADRISALNYGVYLGYAKFLPAKKDKSKDDFQWEYAIIHVVQDLKEKSSVAQRKVMRVYLIHSYPTDTYLKNGGLDVAILSWLRPTLVTNDKQIFLQEVIMDIHVVQNTLQRDGWTIESTIKRLKTKNDAQTVFDKFSAAKNFTQRQVDRIPIHKVGMRNDSVGSYDRSMYGNGGIFVKRG